MRGNAAPGEVGAAFRRARGVPIPTGGAAQRRSEVRRLDADRHQTMGGGHGQDCGSNARRDGADDLDAVVAAMLTAHGTVDRFLSGAADDPFERLQCASGTAWDASPTDEPPDLRADEEFERLIEELSERQARAGAVRGATILDLPGQLDARVRRR